MITAPLMLVNIFSSVSVLSIAVTTVWLGTLTIKSSSMVFSALMSQTTQRASGANATTGTGGVNARQIGRTQTLPCSCNPGSQRTACSPPCRLRWWTAPNTTTVGEQLDLIAAAYGYEGSTDDFLNLMFSREEVDGGSSLVVHHGSL